MAVSVRAAAGLKSVLTGKAANLLAQLAVTVVLARLLSIGDFGVIAVFLTITAIVQVIAGCGLGAALVQRPRIFLVHVYTALIFSALLGLCLYGVAFSLSPAIAGWFNLSERSGVLRFLFLVVIFESIASIFLGLAQRRYAFRLIALADVVTYTVGYAVPSIVLASLGLGAWALAFGLVIQSAVRLLLLAGGIARSYRLRLRHASFSWKALGQLLSFGVGYTVGALASHLATSGDNLVVGRVLSQYALGLYSRAYQLMVFPANFLGQAIDTVLFPVFSGLQGDRGRFREAYFGGLSLVATVAMPVAVFGVVVTPELVLILLGSKWIEVGPILAVLFVSLFFRLGYKFTDAVTRATGKVNVRALIKWIYASLIIGLAWLGAPHGLVAVAIMVSLAIFVNYVLGAALLWVVTRFSIVRWVQLHARGVCIAVLALAVTYGLRVGLSSLGSPVLVILAGCSTVFILFVGSFILYFPRVFLDPAAISTVRVILANIGTDRYGLGRIDGRLGHPPPDTEAKPRVGKRRR